MDPTTAVDYKATATGHVDPLPKMEAAVTHSPLWPVAGVVALALAGCGATTYSRPAGPVAAKGIAPAMAIHGVPAAAAKTLTTRAKIGWRLEGAAIFGHVRAPVSGDGPFDMRAARGQAVIDLPEIKHQEPGTEHVIFLPSQVYLQPKAGALAVLPRGKRWMSAAVSGSDAVSTNFPQFVAQVEGVSPMLLLSELRWGAIRAVPLGASRQIVDRAPTQRYRVSVSLPQALAGIRGPAAPALRQAVQEQLGGGQGVTVFDMLTSVDHQGRVVQIETTLPGTGEGKELMALSYFGARATATAPPQNQTVDITSLTPSGERENNGGGDTDGG